MAKGKQQPSPVPTSRATTPSPARPAWEYLRLQANDTELASGLANAGAGGWELVTAVLRPGEPQRPPCWDLLFKRPAQAGD